MKPSTFAKRLAQHLLKHRANVVSSKEVLVERWSPTYGAQDPGTETIEYVDLDKLCKEIDAFGASLQKCKV